MTRNIAYDRSPENWESPEVWDHLQVRKTRVSKKINKLDTLARWYSSCIKVAAGGSKLSGGGKKLQMRHNILSWATAGAAALLFIAVSPAARATATLTLNDGVGDSITLTDTGAYTQTGTVGLVFKSSNPNSVQFNGSIGGWSTNIISGLSNPPSGNPLMDLGIQDTYSGARTGTMTITWTGTGFINFVGFTLTSGGSITPAGSASVSNTAMVVGVGTIGTTPLGTSASFGSPGNGGTLEEIITISGANGSVHSFTKQTHH